jgi:hypothetical protein
MAQQTSTAAFGVLTVPGAVAAYNVQQQNAGVAAAGVLMIVGEADAGPDYTLETNLNKNSFGPNSVGDVIAKYQSGPIVDAVSAFATPADDENIPGAPTAFIIAKTNKSLQAVGNLPDYDSATYATIGAQLLGAGGNNIKFQVINPTAVGAESAAEVVPTTGAFTYIPPHGSINLVVRVNGGAKQFVTITGGDSPATFVTSDLSSLTGATASGGVDRNAIASVTGTLAAVATGNSVAITRSVAWDTKPTVGDTLVIPTTSVLCTGSGGSTNTAGGYAITAVGNTTITATKISNDPSAGSSSPLLAPATVAATSITADDATEIKAYSPVTITVAAGVPVDGLGKTLEISDLGTGTDTLGFTAMALQFQTTTPVIWVSTAANPNGTNFGAPLTSGTEYEAQLQVSNVVANTQENLVAGGEVALEIGYAGTTGQVVINATSVIVTFTGGPNTTPGSTFTLSLKQYPTIAALASYLDAQPGFTAAPGTALTGMLPSSALDEGTFHIGSTFGALTGRIKDDAYRFATRAIGGSTQIDYVSPPNGVLPTSGLPAPMASPVYLAGGARGGTSNANVTGAMDALKSVRGNFLVPLFSEDASADIIAGTTDESSTYTISLINAYAKTHVLFCSNPKLKKSRQALLSILNTFANDQETAANIAAFRCCMAFQSNQNTSASANAVILFQPWMTAGLAAAMQAAAGYKGIVGRYMNCESVIQAGAGAVSDYDDQNIDDQTTALQAGLLPAQNDQDFGGVKFLSDQTTYGTDNNFVFNSLQAVYVADQISYTLATRMQRAFVGQSLADISATQAVATVQSILSDLLTAKLIAPSDGAPAGYIPGSIVCKIAGTTMTVTLQVFLDGLLYFVPIVFTINQVQQTASA